MPKYRVKKKFRNNETNEVYEPENNNGEELIIEATKERGDQMIERLEEFGGVFLEEVGPTDEEIKAQQEKEKEAAETKAKEKAEKEAAAEKKKADAKSEKDEK